ncbi:hypothetical protein HH214_01565 [Mucilaginibacter robiniae]|uniref:HEPN domain-containing protein n=1 Tax=Mucilaginibacter robiniae TaxID=2728022 RepID=A0A7L5DWL9_9SPHI|nr:hypothetical protein [Mucilaginibacter robiniae]QJD94648.1 hypothetical protein HH214_01565 [Mucilaginibacter robiniae]
MYGAMIVGIEPPKFEGAYSIWKAAEVYRDAASLLYKRMQATIASYDLQFLLVQPCIVLEAFSIELYLKCLYQIENNKQANKIHNLKDLFILLTDVRKERLRLVYDTMCKNSNDLNFIRKSIPDINIELDYILELMSHTFQEFRYSYDSNIKLKGYYCLGEFQEALRTVILELNPEWKILVATGNIGEHDAEFKQANESTTKIIS